MHTSSQAATTAGGSTAVLKQAVLPLGGKGMPAGRAQPAAEALQGVLELGGASLQVDNLIPNHRLDC
jgi:hypothetical protein